MRRSLLTRKQEGLVNKYWKKAIAALSAAGVLTFCGACMAKGDGPQFLLGIQTDFVLGESMVLKDFIEYVEDSDYTIVVTRADGYSKDITKKASWAIEEPGEYTLTYTIKKGANKGVNSFDFVVVAPKMTWDYTMVNQIFDIGQTMDFSEYFEEMNISAQSYYPWEMIMDSVIVNGNTTDLTDETEYTFQTDGIHTFKYHIESEDGQKYSLQQSIKVRYVDQEMLEWLDENNMDVYNAVRLEKDQSIQLDESIYVRDNTQVHPSASEQMKDMSYVSYNGDYGLNDFVVVDFTGNNMPNILFFGDEMTNNVFYDFSGSQAQNKGLVFSNGWTFGTGDPCDRWVNNVNTRYYVYGPNKINRPGSDMEGWFRKQVSTNATAMSMTSILNNGPEDRYRIAIGVTEGTSESFKVAVHCVNLTTGVVLYTGESVLQVKASEGTIADDYYHGKIGLYGQFGKFTKLDKVYPIQEDRTLAQIKATMFLASEFANTAKTTVRPNTTLQVSDYIAPIPGRTYSLKYLDTNGEMHIIDGDTFTLSDLGQYTFIYEDGVNLPGRLKVSVVDLAQEKADELSALKATSYKLTVDANDKFVLGSGSYSTDGGVTSYPTQQNTHDMAYLAFEGQYGLGDFVVIEFTGNNMPTFSFFNDELINTVFRHAKNTPSQNKGLVLNGGWLYNDGSVVDTNIANTFTVYGPNKAFFPGRNYEDKGWFNIVADGASALSYISLRKNATTRYRLALGVVAGDATSITLAIYFVNLDTGAVVINDTFTISGWAYDKCNFPEGYFTGSIGLYGAHGKETVLDKVYGVEKGTTLAAIAAKYAVNG